MKKAVLVAVLVTTFVMIAAPASADLTAWLGRMQSDDLYIDGTTTWGGAVGFSFFEYIGVELVVDYANDSELPFNLEDLEQLFGYDLKVDMLFLSGNILIQYPISGITPYATFGYGGFGIKISAPELKDVEDALSGSTVYNWGFGAKVDLVPWLAIRGDWRQYRLDFTGATSNNILTSLDNPTFERFAIGAALTF